MVRRKDYIGLFPVILEKEGIQLFQPVIDPRPRLKISRMTNFLGDDVFDEFLRRHHILTTNLRYVLNKNCSFIRKWRRAPNDV